MGSTNHKQISTFFDEAFRFPLLTLNRILDLIFLIRFVMGRVEMVRLVTVRCMLRRSFVIVIFRSLNDVGHLVDFVLEIVLHFFVKSLCLPMLIQFVASGLQSL